MELSYQTLKLTHQAREAALDGTRAMCSYPQRCMHWVCAH
uniref:Katanin p60 subunit A-like 2 n=1 Tax=Mus musculus TaxID=10090 RepID=D6RI39_MOUSE